MSVYTGFARMYDELMTNIPYEKWGTYISNILKRKLTEKESPLVVDLACGTGTMTLLLSKMGYDMIGIDLSTDMLAEAQQKTYEAEQNILFLAQDMRQLDLFGTVDAAICVCDGINYIIEPKELDTVFDRVRLFLNPDGVFIFDMNTEYKFKEFLSNQSFEDKAKSGASYEWDNTYDEKTKINEYRVLFYDHTGQEDQEEIDSFTEVHKQRAYDRDDVVKKLLCAGFNKVTVYHEYTEEPPKPDSLKLTYIAEV